MKRKKKKNIENIKEETERRVVLTVNDVLTMTGEWS